MKQSTAHGNINTEEFVWPYPSRLVLLYEGDRMDFIVRAKNTKYIDCEDESNWEIYAVKKNISARVGDCFYWRYAYDRQ